MQVHRDQLREIDADLARGVLSEAEAAATRIEVSRRLLAAADAEAAEAAHHGAAAPGPPRRRPRSSPPWSSPAVGLYAASAPPASPTCRLAARGPGRGERPSRRRRLVARLQQRAAETAAPTTWSGHRLLAQSLAGLGRWPEAAAAQAQVRRASSATRPPPPTSSTSPKPRSSPPAATSRPRRRRPSQRALTLDPQDPVGALLLRPRDAPGRPRRPAYRIWSPLARRGPARRAVDRRRSRRRSAEAQRLAVRPTRPERRRPRRRRGHAAEPTAQAMIQGMVDQLADRLADRGRPARGLGAPRPLARRARPPRRGGGAILAEARGRPTPPTPRRSALLDAARRDAGIAAMTAASSHDPAAFAAALPPGRALMGLDLGTQTIGVAVSDTSRRVASPLETIRRTRFGADAAALLALAAERGDRRPRARPAAQHGRQRGPARPVDPRLRPQPRRA